MTAIFGFFIGCSLFNPAWAQNPEQEKNEFEQKRKDMIETQIKPRGIKNEMVLNAMLKVKRHLFVPQDAIPYAYEDSALPIEKNQTISQPYIVALMTELAHLSYNSKVLEIGTGSGYQAAILAEIVKTVYSIELIQTLADKAKDRLFSMGYRNIKIKHGDGYEGWPENAPFDAIIVTAAAPEIPEQLIKQLKIGGRLIIPVGDFYQELIVITKNKDGVVEKQNIIPVRFVPLVKTNTTGNK